MLILTRRTGESICIGEVDPTKITVICVKGNQVRFGFEAPRHVTIDRQEIYELKHSDEPDPDGTVDE